MIECGCFLATIATAAKDMLPTRLWTVLSDTGTPQHTELSPAYINDYLRNGYIGGAFALNWGHATKKWPRIPLRAPCGVNPTIFAIETLIPPLSTTDGG